MNTSISKEQEIIDLRAKVSALQKINKALMGRVERSVDSAANSFALFESNIVLQQEVNKQTQELRVVNDHLREEICERKRAESKIGASLREKEVLLKEIHHRVKNNLQIITSLLDLQARTIPDSSTKAMFRDSQTRVKSMALIHERLYRSDDLANIDMKEYVTYLTKYLLSTFSGRNQMVEISNQIERIELPVHQAVPCGLIVNELVCNCLKYGFPDKKAGCITISANRNAVDEVELYVADNGVGFQKGYNPEASDTLGQRLVINLANQLGGSIQYESEIGTKITVTFPIQVKTLEGEDAVC